MSSSSDAEASAHLKGSGGFRLAVAGLPYWCGSQDARHDQLQVTQFETYSGCTHVRYFPVCPIDIEYGRIMCGVAGCPNFGVVTGVDPADP